jgi:hypothetical protein
MRAQRAGESALLLLDVIDGLQRANVRYAVGAMAGSVHGVVRASMDADAVIAVPTHEVAILESRLRASGLETELRYGDADDPIAAVLAISDSFGNRVDLLVGLRGLDPAAFDRALDVPFQGEPLRVVACEDFVAMKLFAGHEGGAAAAPGLYTLGLNFMRRRKSSYIHGAEDDVRDLGTHLVRYLRGAGGGTPRRDHAAAPISAGVTEAAA